MACHEKVFDMIDDGKLCHVSNKLISITVQVYTIERLYYDMISVGLIFAHGCD